MVEDRSVICRPLINKPLATVLGTEFNPLCDNPAKKQGLMLFRGLQQQTSKAFSNSSLSFVLEEIPAEGADNQSSYALDKSQEAEAPEEHVATGGQTPRVKVWGLGLHAFWICIPSTSGAVFFKTLGLWDVCTSHKQSQQWSTYSLQPPFVTFAYTHTSRMSMKPQKLRSQAL